MARESEEMLGKLYAWGATIDEIYELGEDDPNYDEDKALEAYEEIIHVAMRGQSEREKGAAVPSLAAQLLAQHFYKFPHVHLNVVDALVGLCEMCRASFVRIHASWALLQITKTAAAGRDALSSQCRQRIAKCAESTMDSSNRSAVIYRHATLLKEAVERASEGKAPPPLPSSPVSKKSTTKDATSPPPSKRQRTSDSDSRDGLRDRQDEPKRDERSKRADEPSRGRSADRVGDTASRNTDERDRERDRQRERDRERERDRDRDRERERDQDRNKDRPRDSDRDQRKSEPSTATSNNQSCPPGPHLFVGGLPRTAVSSDISTFLGEIDPSLSPASVQVKIPSNRNQAGYAFVSMSSTRHALDAIRFVKRTKYNGRMLICDFARGPPCATLSFVEKKGNKTMHDDDAVADAEFASKPAFVWKELCRMLERYGEMDIIEKGKVRFRDVECAKAVIRRHHFNVDGHELLPVYENGDDVAINGRERERGGGGDRDQRGRSRERPVRDDRDRDRDRERRNSETAADRNSGGDDASRNNNNDRKRRRSPSPPPRRDDAREPSRGDAGLSRYGPGTSDGGNNRRDSGSERKRGDDRADNNGDRRREQPVRRSRSPDRGARRSASPRRRPDDDRGAPARGRDGADKFTTDESRRRGSNSSANRGGRSTDDRSVGESTRDQRDRRGRDNDSGARAGANRAGTKTERSRSRSPIRTQNQRRSNSPPPPMRRDSGSRRGDDVVRRGRSPVRGATRSRSADRSNSVVRSTDDRRRDEHDSPVRRSPSRSPLPSPVRRRRTPSPDERERSPIAASPRSVPTATIDDMDECMVDYDEDDE